MKIVTKTRKNGIVARGDVSLSPCLHDNHDNRGEFNNASARRALADWYLSLFITCKAGHQYNERPRALALLNLPLVAIVWHTYVGAKGQMYLHLPPN